MKHSYTTDTGDAGVWLAAGDRVYCRWRWDPAAGRLTVHAGEATRSWTTPEIDHGLHSGIRLDLPETAKDIAQLIEREARKRQMLPPDASSRQSTP